MGDPTAVCVVVWIYLRPMRAVPKVGKLTPSTPGLTCRAAVFRARSIDLPANLALFPARSSGIPTAAAVAVFRSKWSGSVILRRPKERLACGQFSRGLAWRSPDPIPPPILQEFVRMLGRFRQLGCLKFEHLPLPPLIDDSCLAFCAGRQQVFSRFPMTRRVECLAATNCATARRAGGWAGSTSDGDLSAETARQCAGFAHNSKLFFSARSFPCAY